MKSNRYCITTYERVTDCRLIHIRLLIFIVILLILFFGSICIVKLDQIQKSQSDIADQANYIRQEVEIPNNSQENRSQVNSESLTTKERDLVQRVVAAESRGEDMQGQMAVAQTILDRAELWNMTVSEVVQAPDQYADPYQGEISDSIKLAVANIFDGGIRVFDEPVTHFYSGDKPYWADEKINRGSVGRHEFCY